MQTNPKHTKQVKNSNLQGAPDARKASKTPTMRYRSLPVPPPHSICGIIRQAFPIAEMQQVLWALREAFVYNTADYVATEDFKETIKKHFKIVNAFLREIREAKLTDEQIVKNLCTRGEWVFDLRETLFLLMREYFYKNKKVTRNRLTNVVDTTATLMHALKYAMLWQSDYLSAEWKAATAPTPPSPKITPDTNDKAAA